MLSTAIPIQYVICANHRSRQCTELRLYVIPATLFKHALQWLFVSPDPFVHKVLDTVGNISCWIVSLQYKWKCCKNKEWFLFVLWRQYSCYDLLDHNSASTYTERSCNAPDMPSHLPLHMRKNRHVLKTDGRHGTFHKVSTFWADSDIIMRLERGSYYLLCKEHHLSQLGTVTPLQFRNQFSSVMCKV